MRRGVGGLVERVAFDPPSESGKNDYGSVKTGWREADAIERPARFIYTRGGEAGEADSLTGKSVFKVKIHQSAAARAITSDFRMRDVRRRTEFQIREVDNVSDQTWIWFKVESAVSSGIPI